MQGNAECNRAVRGHCVFKKALGPHSVAIPPLLGLPRTASRAGLKDFLAAPADSAGHPLVCESPAQMPHMWVISVHLTSLSFFELSLINQAPFLELTMRKHNACLLMFWPWGSHSTAVGYCFHQLKRRHEGDEDEKDKVQFSSEDSGRTYPGCNFSLFYAPFFICLRSDDFMTEKPYIPPSLRWSVPTGMSALLENERQNDKEMKLRVSVLL